MEAEEVLKLFDSCWFEREIFMIKQDLHLPPAKFVHQKMDRSEESMIYGVQNFQIRSLSDCCLGLNLETAPLGSALDKQKLQKISSGKEVEEFFGKFTGKENAEKSCIKKQCSRKKKGRKKMSRSLSALEFEELKGFMDLGFVFTEEDKNPGLVSVIPGLQKWGKMTDENENLEGKAEISRPYLSEAWGVLNKRKEDGKFLMNWEIPSMQNEIIMKDHLRNWAHTVASLLMIY